MNLTEEEKTKLFESLERLEQSQHLTNQALFGDEKIGLKGVVQDLQSLKHWRTEVATKTSYIAGGVAVVSTGLMMFGKFILLKLTGKE